MRSTGRNVSPHDLLEMRHGLVVALRLHQRTSQVATRFQRGRVVRPIGLLMAAQRLLQQLPALVEVAQAHPQHREASSNVRRARVVGSHGRHTDAKPVFQDWQRRLQLALGHQDQAQAVIGERDSGVVRPVDTLQNGQRPLEQRARFVVPVQRPQRHGDVLQAGRRHRMVGSVAGFGDSPAPAGTGPVRPRRGPADPARWPTRAGCDRRPCDGIPRPVAESPMPAREPPSLRRSVPSARAARPGCSEHAATSRWSSPSTRMRTASACSYDVRVCCHVTEALMGAAELQQEGGGLQIAVPASGSWQCERLLGEALRFGILPECFVHGAERPEQLGLHRPAAPSSPFQSWSRRARATPARSSVCLGADPGSTA